MESNCGRRVINLIPESSIFQSNHNPLGKKKKIQYISISQFCNYKQFPNDSLESFHDLENPFIKMKTQSKIEQRDFLNIRALSIPNLTPQCILPSENKSKNSPSEEEMIFELSLFNSLTAEIERELKLIIAIPPIFIKEIELRKVNLVCRASKPTLILDLDETLIHACYSPLSNSNYNCTTAHKIQIRHSVNQYHNINIYSRPFLIKFLKTVAVRYELIVSSLLVIYCFREGLRGPYYQFY